MPQRYEGKFPEGTLPIHKCIGYSDYALRRFFNRMKQYPWFENTLFVFTADHTNASQYAEYQTDAGLFEVPIAFYCAGDSTLRGISHTPVAQTDVMPTILAYLHNEQPFVAFGADALAADSLHYVCNYNNGVYQLFSDSLLLQFDGQTTTAVYNYIDDRLLQHNLNGMVDVNKEERYLKAVVQQYIERMVGDSLTVQ